MKKKRFKKRVKNSEIKQNIVNEVKNTSKTEVKIDKAIENTSEPKKTNVITDSNVAFKLNYDEEDLISFKDACNNNSSINSWKYNLSVNGKAKTIKCAQTDNIAILTTRLPKAKEEERVIFGVFLMDDVFNGTEEEAGFVKTKSKYKLALTDEEAAKIPFWKYYHNEKSLTSTVWGSAPYKKVDDIKAAQVLSAIVEIKNGTKDEQLAKEFLNHFCQTHGVNLAELPTPNGPLA